MDAALKNDFIQPISLSTKMNQFYQQQQQQQQQYGNGGRGNSYQQQQQQQHQQQWNGRRKEKVLNVAEKPSMAKSIASILSGNRFTTRNAFSKVSLKIISHTSTIVITKFEI